MCRGPADGASWAYLQRTPTVIGLDYLQVKTDKPVHIKAVDLTGGQGGLRVVASWFVPAGGVGAFDYKGTGRRYGPLSFRARIDMPGATLTKLHPTKAQLSALPSSQDYELVVAVLPIKDFSSAAAAKITYTAGGRTGHLTGIKYLGLTSANGASCDPSATSTP